MYKQKINRGGACKFVDFPTPNVTDTLTLFKSVGQITLNKDASPKGVHIIDE